LETEVNTPPSPTTRERSHEEQWRDDPLGFLRRCAGLGDVVLLQFDRPFYLLSRAELVEEVLQNKQGFFVKDILPTDHQGGHNPESLKYEVFRSLLGDNVLTTEGDDWRRRRRILAPPFHHDPTLSYVPTITEHIQRLTSTWQPGQTIEMHDQMMELTLGIVSTVLMGVDLGGEAKEEGLAFRQALEHFYRPSDDGESFKIALQKLHQAVDRIIQERRNSPLSSDLLTLMVHAEEGEQLTDEDLRNELLTILFAGHETTANAGAWMWAVIAQHPEEEARLLAEVNTVLGGRIPDANDLPNLTYARMIVDESLRMYPPSWFLGRFTESDWEAGGFPIGARSGVLVSQWVLHHDPRYFADPDSFEPGRWSNNFEFKLPRGSYFPFGDGARICLAKPLALMELTLFAAVISQSWKLSLSPGQELVPEPMNTIRPKGGLMMEVSRR
jgi:cytochrome P450